MTGYAWQRDLDAQHARYLAAGLAIVVRTAPPTAGGRFIKKGPPDYIALIKGRTLVLDAKCYKEGFCVADLPAHQAAFLHNAERLGHTSGLVFPGELCWWADFGPGWLRWRNEGGVNERVRGVAFVGTDWLEVVL